MSLGEAMEKMLHEKKLSTKIDYEVLKNLTNGGTSNLVSKMAASANNSNESIAQSNTLSQDLTDAVNDSSSAYLPGVIDETPSTSQVRYVMFKVRYVIFKVRYVMSKVRYVMFKVRYVMFKVRYVMFKVMSQLGSSM